MAHLGVLKVVPKFSLKFKSSTFITAPSVPKLKPSLLSPMLSISFIASSIPSTLFLYRVYIKS